MMRESKEQYDRDLHGTPIDFVIKKVSEYQDVDPCDLPVLNDAIEDTLITNFFIYPPSAGELQFQWGEIIVTLTFRRTIKIRPVRY